MYKLLEDESKYLSELKNIYTKDDFLKEIQEEVKEELEEIQEGIEAGTSVMGHNYVTLTGGTVVIGALIAAAAIAWYSMKLYIDYVDKEGSKCRNFRVGTSRHKMCIMQVRHDAYVLKGKTMKEKSKLCKNSKNKAIYEIKLKLCNLIYNSQ